MQSQAMTPSFIKVGMRIRRFLVGLGVLIAVLGLALLGLFLLFDVNDYRAEVEAKASAALGRKVSISGMMRLHPAFQPRLVIEDLHVANPEWASRQDLIQIQRFEVHMSLLPLFQGRVVIPEIGLDGLDLLLEQGPEGVNNWSFGKKSDSLDGPTPEDDETVRFPAIGQLVLRQSVVAYRAGPSETPHRVVVASATAQAPQHQPLQLSVDGTYRSVPMQLEFTGGSLEELLAPTQPWPLVLSLQAEGATLGAKGNLALAVPTTGIALDLSLVGDRVSSVNRLFEVDLPPFGSFEILGKVLFSNGDLSVTGLQARLGRSDISGAMSLVLKETKPHFYVELASESIQLDDFLTNGEGSGTDASTQESEEPLRFEDVTIPVALLRSTSADVRWTARQILKGETNFGEIGFAAQLLDGQLIMDYLRMASVSGEVDAQLRLDVNQRVPSVSLEVKGRKVDYGRLLKSFVVSPRLEGTTDLGVTFFSQGETLSTLLDNTVLQIGVGPTKLRLLDPEKASSTPVTISKAQVEVKGQRHLKVKMTGSFKRKALGLNLSGGTLRDLLEGREPWPVSLSARAADLSVWAKGRLIPESHGMDFSLAFRLKGERLTSFDPELPALGPYKFRARVDKKKDRILLTELLGQVDKTDITGNIALVLGEPRPRLEGELRSSRLRLQDVLKPTGGPLPVEGFRALDVRLLWRAKVGLLGPLELEQVAVKATLKAGLLAVAPISGRFPSRDASPGTFEGSLLLDARKHTAMFVVKGKARGVHYGDLLRQAELTDRLRGVGNLNVEFRGAGRTMDAVVKHSSVRVALEETTLRSARQEDAFPAVLISEANLAFERGGKVTLSGRGSFRDTPFTLKSSGGEFHAVLDGSKSWPIALSGKLGEVSTELSGHVSFPIEGEDFDIRFALNGDRLNMLDPLLNTTLPSIGSFALSGLFADTKEGFRVSQLQGRLAGSEVAGRLYVIMTGPRPRVIGTLTSETIQLAGGDGPPSEPDEPETSSLAEKIVSPAETVGSAVGEVGETAMESVEPVAEEGSSGQPEARRVFPDWSFPVDGLGIVDLDLEWKVHHVRGGVIDLGDFTVGVKLQDRLLALSPIQGSLSGGTIDGSLELNDQGEVPTVSVQTEVHHLDYGRLLTATEVTFLIEGAAGASLTLEGRGRTLREALSVANGSLEFIAGPFRRKERLVDLWASNLMTGLFSAAWAEEGEWTESNCMVARIGVVDGMAETRAMLEDSERYTIAGAGTLDLGSEYLDLVLTPWPKEVAFVSLAHTVRVSGPLSRPEVSTDPAKIAGSKVWHFLDVADPVGVTLKIPKLFTRQPAGTDGENGSEVPEEENPCLIALDVKKGESLTTKKVVRGAFDKVKGVWKGFRNWIGSLGDGDQETQ